MKERPIIMSAASVRNILAGTKSQSRRVVKPQPAIVAGRDASWYDLKGDFWRNASQYARDCCPYGEPGQRLWVREVWRREDFDFDDGVWYAAVGFKADGSKTRTRIYTVGGADERTGWRSPLFMPRWASRITLEVTAVRVERLQGISEEDARAEGVEPRTHTGPCRDYHYAAQVYAELWDELNGRKAPWVSNPWVWVISFRRRG